MMENFNMWTFTVTVRGKEITGYAPEAQRNDGVFYEDTSTYFESDTHDAVKAAMDKARKAAPTIKEFDVTVSPTFKWTVV